MISSHSEIFHSKIIIAFSIMLLVGFKVVGYKPLIIRISNIKEKGTIIVGCYNNKSSFPITGKELLTKKIDPAGREVIEFVIYDVAFGEYAIAVYQDSNADNMFTTNFLGIPKEPFGFSRNVKPTFTVPKFDECKIIYTENNNTFEIKLID